MKKLLVPFCIAIIIFNACTPTPKQNTKSEKKENYISEKSIEELATEVLLILKNKEYPKLSTYAHPDKGIMFVPYGYIDTNEVNIIAANKFLDISGYEEYHWGSFDGSGDSINLSIEEYFEKFVYDKPYIDSAQTFTDSTISTGNIKNNLKDIFPNSRYVDYYIKGTEQYAEMDWKDLRLVFEKHNGHNYLVAIIHYEWTI